MKPNTHVINAVQDFTTTTNVDERSIEKLYEFYAFLEKMGECNIDILNTFLDNEDVPVGCELSMSLQLFYNYIQDSKLFDGEHLQVPIFSKGETVLVSQAQIQTNRSYITPNQPSAHIVPTQHLTQSTVYTMQGKEQLTLCTYVAKYEGKHVVVIGYKEDDTPTIPPHQSSVFFHVDSVQKTPSIKQKVQLTYQQWLCLYNADLEPTEED